MPLPLAALGLLGGSALASGLSGATSRKGRYRQLPTVTSPQNQALDQLLAQGQQNANFDALENRARNQFQSQTIPSIAERFTSMGEGGQRSSAFQNALGQSASDLESQLASLRAQYGMQQIQAGLMPRFENVYEAGGPTALSGLLGGISQGLGSFGNLGLGNYLGLFGDQQQPAAQSMPQRDQTAQILKALQALQAQQKSQTAQVPPTPGPTNPYAQSLSFLPHNPNEGAPAQQKYLLRGLI